MGGLDTEITDDDDHGRPRDRLVRAARRDADGRTGSACAPRRRPGSSVVSTRTGSIARSPGSSSCSRETCPGSGRARRRRRRAGRGAPAGRAVHGRADQRRSTGSSAPRSTADDLPALLDPIGYTVSRRRRHASRRAAVVAARQRGRDRRHRGGRPPLRLRADRQDGAEVDRARTARRRSSTAAANSARCCSGSASPRRCRTRSSRPTRWRRRASTARR